MSRVFYRLAIVALVAGLLASRASAQSFARFSLDSFDGKDLAETYDHYIFQVDGHSNDAPPGSNKSQVDFGDSFGRVRLSRDDADAPFVPYRILNINAGTDSRYIRSTMDEIDSGIGLHLGTYNGWKVGAVLGAGFSTTRGFVNANGVFGIGDVTAEHKLDDHNSLVLAVDYAGNGSFLPDIPLPGFALLHSSKYLDFMFGYPTDRVIYRPFKPLEITAAYQVPYSFDVDAEYRVVPHFGFYADTGNFFQGFVTAHQQDTPDGNISNRQFYQMRRAEVGLRFIFQPLVDASIGFGYAFDQGFSRGFDIRDLQGFGHIQNEPYLAVMLRGRF